MALRKNTTPTAESPVNTAAPAFEAEDGNVINGTATAVAEPAAAAPTEEAKASADASAKVEASTAIGKAQASAVGAVAVGGKFKAALVDYQNVIAIEDLENLGVGTFPRITADLSGLVMDKTKELGKVAKIELLSWNYRYIVTPGVDNDEANALVRYSYDGVTLIGTGENVKDYLQQLKEVDGYDKATVKTYVELWGNLASVNGEDVAPEDRQMVQVQLSPQSVNQFKRFQLELGVKSARGVAPSSNIVVITANKKELNGNRFGYMEFSSK